MREMKNSGVEWIDVIPKEWEVQPLKSLFSFGKGLPITKENLTESGVSVISYGQIHAKWNTGVTTHDELKRYVDKSYLETNPSALVNRGDIIVADTSEDREGCGNCAYIDTDETIFAGYHTIILKSLQASDNKYLAYLFLTDAWRSQIRKRVSGVKLFSISRRILGSTTVLVPDNAADIVRYLDGKCSQVDALIANVQAQIEKLKAYKQSVITEVVTKGLDPTVPMKDSGVEWIGEIPEHWNVCKSTRFIDSTQNGLTRRDLSESSGYIVLKLKNISAEGKIDYSEINRIQLSQREIDTYSLIDGDFLFVRVNGSRSLVGKCAIYQEVEPIVAYNDHIIRVRLMALMNRYFYHWYLLSYTGKTEIELHTVTSAGQFTISGNGLRDIWAVLPPLEEQKEISAFLDEKCAQIDQLIAIKQKKIDKLNEYKKSLIYEYVTGKKEVS